MCVCVCVGGRGWGGYDSFFLCNLLREKHIKLKIISIVCQVHCNVVYGMFCKKSKVLGKRGDFIKNMSHYHYH